jgi:hypothetical protein
LLTNAHRKKLAYYETSHFGHELEIYQAESVDKKRALVEAVMILLVP